MKREKEYFIIDRIGRTLGRYETYDEARNHLMIYTGREITEEKLIIVDDEGNEY